MQSSYLSFWASDMRLTLYSGGMLVQQTTMPLNGCAGSMDRWSSSEGFGEVMIPWPG